MSFVVVGYRCEKQYYSGEKGMIEIIQIDPILVTWQ